jgi:hypothetical protein
MKTQANYTILILLFFMISCSSSKTTPDSIRKISQKIESKNYVVSMSNAYPMRMQPVFLSSGYQMTLKNDSAFTYLPYYGVLHSAPMDNREGGIKFAEPLNDYSIKSNKKSNGWDIHFKIYAKEFTYDVSMKVFDNGNASVTFGAYQFDPISFSGEIRQ